MGAGIDAGPGGLDAALAAPALAAGEVEKGSGVEAAGSQPLFAFK